MQLLHTTAGEVDSSVGPHAARVAKRGRLFDAGQAAGLSLPGGVHSAPFMNESFGVSARWLV
jgi:hypothetical protein